MRLMDRCRTELPFYGSRRMVIWLVDEGHTTVSACNV